MKKTDRGVRYKQPSSFNLVSLFFLALFASGAYWAYCFGPAYVRNFQVKGLVHEAATAYYKLSLLEPALRPQKTRELLDETRKKIVSVLGFDDPGLVVQLLINEETKRVHVVAEYDHIVELVGTHLIGPPRSRVLHFKTLVESDYRPNDW